MCLCAGACVPQDLSLLPVFCGSCLCPVGDCWFLCTSAGATVAKLGVTAHGSFPGGRRRFADPVWDALPFRALH